MTSISPRTTHELPRLYAWDVRDGDTGRSGVTSDRNVALGHVHHFVRAGASGARGKVRQVGLSPTGGTEYVGLRIIGEAWLDEMSGAAGGHPPSPFPAAPPRSAHEKPLAPPGGGRGVLFDGVPGDPIKTSPTGGAARSATS